MGSPTRIILLRSNQRACGVLLAFAGLLVLTGGLLVLFGGWSTAIGLTLALIGAFASFNIVREMLRPRLAYEDSELLVFAGGWRPFRIPLEIVEVFFAGQGPSKLPQPTGKPLENSTIVVRLAESATEWHKKETNTRLAHWCEGYITLRGVWCEPINTETIRRLNNTLVDTKRQLKKVGAIG